MGHLTLELAREVEKFPGVDGVDLVHVAVAGTGAWKRLAAFLALWDGDRSDKNRRLFCGVVTTLLRLKVTGPSSVQYQLGRTRTTHQADVRGEKDAQVVEIEGLPVYAFASVNDYDE